MASAGLVAILAIFAAGGLAMFTRRLPSLLVLPAMALAISGVALIRWDQHAGTILGIGAGGFSRGASALGREAALVLAGLAIVLATIRTACREGYLATPVAGRALALLVPAGAIAFEISKGGTPPVLAASRGALWLLGAYALVVAAFAWWALGGSERTGGYVDWLAAGLAGGGAAIAGARLLAPWTAHWYYAGELAPLKSAFFGFAADLDLILAKVVQEGAVKLAANAAVFIFGSMLAVFLSKTGLAREIVKTAAELGGDRPRALAAVMLAVMTVLFTTLSGLGSIVLVGTIVLPLLLALEAPPESAAAVLLFGVSLGGILNPANWGLYIETFKIPAPVVLRFSLPLCAIGFGLALIFIRREFPGVPGEAAAGRRARTVFADDPRRAHPWRTLLAQAARQSLVVQPNGLRPIMVVTPLLPLVLILGFGVPPVAAFVTALLFGTALYGGPRRADLLIAVAVEGLTNVAPAVLILMGLGMLLNSLMLPVVGGTQAAVSQIMAPAVGALVPASPLAYVLVFTLFSPLALYRGPLNVWGMGLGLAQVIRSAGTLGAPLVMGMLQSVGQVQGICDPTNTSNIWIAGHVRVTTRKIMVKTLPYAVLLAMAGLILASVVFRGEFGPTLQAP